MGLKDLVKRLSDGEFDGGFSDRESNGAMTSLYIKGGTAYRRYEGKSSRFFNGKENKRIQGKVELTEYSSDEQKEEFIQRFGFIGDLFGYDEDARAESGKYYDARKKQ